MSAAPRGRGGFAPTTSEVISADLATRSELLAVEERRRRALIDVDLPALDDLFDDSLVHIHAPGLIHDKNQLMEHVAVHRAYLDMARGEITIRLVGDVAIMTGRLTNRLRTVDGGERVLGGAATQVIRRCGDGAWRFLGFQLTPDGEEAWPRLPSENRAEGGER